MKTWINGHIHVMDGTIMNTLMVNDEGMIIDALDGTNNEVIDLNGRCVYPAFVDCHIHLMGYGQHLTRLHIKHLDQKEAILTFIKTHLIGDFIYIEGYQPSDITKHDLDAISTHAMMYLRHEDYHGMTVNSNVLRSLEMTSEDGILLEQDATKVMQSIKKSTHEELVEFLKKAYQSLYAFGVIAGHSDDLYYFNGYHDTLQAFIEAAKTHPFYAHLLMHHLTLEDHIKSQHKIGPIDPFIELGAVKLFYDGTTGSKTALMTHPYTDQTYGERIYDHETFTHYVKRARQFDLAVAVHVIGDQGLLELCQILKQYPVKKGLKDRIIHASYASKKALDIIQDIDVFLDLQPQFLTSDLPHTLTSFQTAPDYIFPMKTYHDLGLNYGLSSDAPVEIPNPILGMHAAIFREINNQVYQKEERLSRMEALKAYTTRAWSLTHEKGGYLKPGYPAHLIMTNQDFLTVPEKDFLNTRVLETYIKGVKVFQHKKT